MKIKIFSILMVLITISSMFSQSDLNNYKYVIVPKKFDFLKQDNQYRLNELTKFLFEKYGFSALMEGENYPDDLVKDRCLALKSDVNSDSGLFKTKLFVELKDCNDQTVFTSQVGETREKEYEKAYNEALRKAFKSFEGVAYKYEAKTEVVAVGKQEKVEDVVPTTIAQVETETIKETISGTDILYAQAIENGFQLVDSSPKVIYKIKPTSLNNVFFVEGKQAILYKKGNDWVLEYYENTELKQDILNIKF